MPGLGGISKPPASSALKQSNSGRPAGAVSRKLGSFCRSVAGDLAVLSGGRSTVGLGVTFTDGVTSRHVLVFLMTSSTNVSMCMCGQEGSIVKHEFLKCKHFIHYRFYLG